MVVKGAECRKNVSRVKRYFHRLYSRWRCRPSTQIQIKRTEEEKEGRSRRRNGLSAVDRNGGASREDGGEVFEREKRSSVFEETSATFPAGSGAALRRCRGGVSAGVSGCCRRSFTVSHLREKQGKRLNSSNWIMSTVGSGVYFRFDAEATVGGRQARGWRWNRQSLRTAWRLTC